MLHNWETLAPSEPTQPDGPTGWRPMRRAVWVDGVLNDGEAMSRGWSVEMAIPWSILGQVRRSLAEDIYLMHKRSIDHFRVEESISGGHLSDASWAIM